MSTAAPEKPQEDLSSPDKNFIQSAFDSIAHRYDFLNTLLSFNLDEMWRKKSKELIYQDSQKKILDLGIGSGKFLNIFLKEKKWDHAVGLDFSSEMLNVARKELPDSVSLIQGDFHKLPFLENSFDVIISAFTLRSVQDMNVFLQGIYKILNPQGRVGFLCLTRPTNFFCKLLFYPYLKVYLPIMGRLFSGDAKAYQFLSQSVEKFPPVEETIEKMEKAGFKNIQTKVFTFGASTLIVGDK